MSMSLFPGQYRLVSSHRRYNTGHTVELYGPGSAGRTGYDACGRMWVVLLRPAIVYYGSYDVDERAQTIVHRVEAALDPDWAGKMFVRHYTFVGDLLTLVIRNANHEVHTVYERLPEVTPCATQEVTA
jgi:hypothetical protein